MALRKRLLLAGGLLLSVIAFSMAGDRILVAIPSPSFKRWTWSGLRDTSSRSDCGKVGIPRS